MRPAASPLPAARAVTWPPRTDYEADYEIDIRNTPPPVALNLSAGALEQLARERFPTLSDLSCDLSIDPNGRGYLRFRAVR